MAKNFRGIKPRHAGVVLLSFVFAFAIFGAANFIDSSTGSGYKTLWVIDEDPSLVDTDVDYLRIYNVTTNNYLDGSYAFDNDTGELFLQHDSGADLKAVDISFNVTITKLFGQNWDRLSLYFKPDVDANITGYQLKAWDGASTAGTLIDNTTDFEIDATNGTTLNIDITEAQLASWKASYPDEHLLLVFSWIVGEEPNSLFFKPTISTSTGTTLSSMAWLVGYWVSIIGLLMANYFIIKDNLFPNLKLTFWRRR